MQEIVLILSSLAGVATAVAVRKMPRDKNQLLTLGASSQIKNQINLLKIEKDILSKTISRLYQSENEFSKIQKNKLENSNPPCAHTMQPNNNATNSTYV